MYNIGQNTQKLREDSGRGRGDGGAVGIRHHARAHHVSAEVAHKKRIIRFNCAHIFTEDKKQAIRQLWLYWCPRW